MCNGYEEIESPLFLGDIDHVEDSEIDNEIDKVFDDAMNSLKTSDGESNVSDQDAGNVDKSANKDKEGSSSYHYQFPILTSRSELEEKLSMLGKFSDEKILLAVKKWKEGHREELNEYSGSTRISYCAINIVLNERKLIAPYFREFHKLSSHKNLTAYEKDLGGDRQVIDLHYLYCSYREYIRPTEKEYKGLFKNNTFNFKMASDYANEKWRAETSALKSFKLSDFRQIEMAVYKSKKVYDRVYNIEKGMTDIELKVNNHISKSSSRKKECDIPDMMDDYYYLKLANGSHAIATEFRKLKTGRVFTGKKLKAENERVRKALVWFEDTLNVKNW